MIKKKINDYYQESIFKLRKMKYEINFAQKSSKFLISMNCIRACFQNLNIEKRWERNMELIET